jgi:hypothetical protein
MTPTTEPEPEVAPEPAIEPEPIAEPKPVEALTGWSAWYEERDGRAWKITQKDGERVTSWEDGP